MEPTIPDYWVDHYPDTAKRRDNIETLRAEAARYPHDARSAFYYARELYYSGLWVPARAEMERFIAMDYAWKTEVGEAYRMLGHMDAIPERWYWRAISEDPRRREPYCDLARHYHTKNRLDEARAMVKLADARTNENLYVTDTACWGDEWEEFKKQLEGSQP